MVKAAVFDNETEAYLAKNFLLNKDIKAEIVGSKEYTAHVLGGGAGHFELMVDPVNLVLARGLLAALNGPVVVDTQPPVADHFRRAIFYAFVAAILLPLIFNYASLVQAVRFWRASDKGAAARIKMGIIFSLQALPLILLGLMLRSCDSSLFSNH